MHVMDVMAEKKRREEEENGDAKIIHNVITHNRGTNPESDGHCYRIEAVMHVIDVIPMVMDIVTGLKLSFM